LGKPVGPADQIGTKGSIGELEGSTLVNRAAGSEGGADTTGAQPQVEQPVVMEAIQTPQQPPSPLGVTPEAHPSGKPVGPADQVGSKGSIGQLEEGTLMNMLAGSEGGADITGTQPQVEQPVLMEENRTPQQPPSPLGVIPGAHLSVKPVRPADQVGPKESLGKLEGDKLSTGLPVVKV